MIQVQFSKYSLKNHNLLFLPEIINNLSLVDIKHSEILVCIINLFQLLLIKIQADNFAKTKINKQIFYKVRSERDYQEF